MRLKQEIQFAWDKFKPKIMKCFNGIMKIQKLNLQRSQD